MVATVYLVEYSSYGAQKNNNEDDGLHNTAQIPCRIVKHHEIDAGSAQTVEFQPETTYFKLTSVGGAVWFNFDSGDNAGDSLIADNRDVALEGFPYFHGVWIKTSKVHSRINIIDAT